MQTITAAVISHAFERGLRHMLGNLMYQSRRPDETIVLHSGYKGNVLAKLYEDFSWPRWVQCEDRDDYGHDKRAKGIQIARSAYIGFFNDDDRYDRRYIEKMMRPAETGSAAIYCNWSGSSQDCTFCLGSSTAGNFIVHADLARIVGYTGRGYAADGAFINSIAAHVDAVKIDEVLYTHNALERDAYA